MYILEFEAQLRFGSYYRYALIKKLKLDQCINSSNKWLDIGCYDGTILRFIVAQEKIGIDIETKRQKDVHIIKASGEYLPFKDNSLGVITAFDILEHIKRDFQVINQVENKLSKEGLFLLTVPHENENIFPKFLKKWLIFHKWKHVRYGYNKKILKGLFKGKWKLKFIYWNNNISNFLYFILQFIWKILPTFTKLIIHKLIKIEFIRTKRYSSNHGHIIIIARKK
ncbi:MAG: class I SAM-dependent methyltransferase [Promethearchaeota archaeon]